MTSATDLRDLEAMISSMSFNPSNIDIVADMIEQRLKVSSFDRQAYRSMAKQMFELKLDRMQNNGEGRGASSAFGQGGFRSSPRRPDSPRTSFGAQQQITTSQPAFQRPMRGRSPARNQSSNSSGAFTSNNGHGITDTPSRPRSRTPVRSFFGFGGGNSVNNHTNNNKIPPSSDFQAQQPRQENQRRARSRSPFAMFGSRKAAASTSVPLHVQQQQHAYDDEKKEFDTIWANAAKDPMPSAAGSVSINFGNMSLSEKRSASPAPGRESPALDPSAEKPATPSRSSSPVPTSRNYSQQPPTAALSPVRAMIDNLNKMNIATKSSGPTATPGGAQRNARPASPYGRPGLQEDSDGDGDHSVVSQSPARLSSTRSHGRGHSRSNSYTPRLTPKRFKDADDDDESVQQPPMRSQHRKSISDTEALFDGLDIPELRLPENKGKASDGQSFLTSGKADCFAEASLTPPGQPSEAKTPHYGDKTVPNPFKTGAGKMRRKDGTPKAFASNASEDDSGANPPMMRPKVFTNNPFAPGPSTIFASSNNTDDSQGSEEPVKFHIGAAVPKPKSYQFRRPSYNKESQRPAAPAHNVQSVFSPPQSTQGSQSERAFSPMDVEMLSPTAGAGSATFQQPLQPPEPPALFNIGVSGGSKTIRPTFRRAKELKAPKPVKPAAVFTTISPASSSETTAASTPSTTANTAHQAEYNSAAAAATVQIDENERRRNELVSTMRNEARSLYVAGEFKASIHTYTKAIKLFDSVAPNETNDTLAVLFSNRAACFVMLGAYEMAQDDCLVALKHVSDPSTPGAQESFSTDSGLMLKVKLLTRLARAQQKQGDCKSSQEAFERAIFDANQASMIIQSLPSQQKEHLESTLGQMVTEANIGLMELDRLSELFDKIMECTLRSSDVRRNNTEALGHVNMALSVAGGSSKLLQKKLTLLADMKRWREAAAFCERLAASRVPFDGVFVDDLKSKNPLPGVPEACHLKTSTFADAADEETTNGNILLSSKAAGEAALRLPYLMTPLYLRALRLEERYPAAEAALQALDELVDRMPSLRDKYGWLKKERSKIQRTKLERERGDELFRLGDFDLACAQYGSCLLIDSEDSLSSPGDGTAGGRLHAVLHCNRAACLMAVRRFHEAIEECTAALRIHSRYMKAMLRRSRCYTRLNRYQEAVSEYERWLDLVEDARNSKTSTFATTCFFDGPKDVTNADIAQVKRELDEAHRSKRRADAAARGEASRRRERQTSWDAFSRNSFNDNASTASAQDRRDFWYNRENDSRRWDSFSGRRPHGTGHSRSKSWGESQHEQQQQNSKKKNPLGSPGSDPSIDHYTVLEISSNATDEEIKKKFRRLALQYHPDKNKSEGAADKFRRIKLAYETLSDPAARRQYDAELRVGRRF